MEGHRSPPGGCPELDGPHYSEHFGEVGLFSTLAKGRAPGLAGAETSFGVWIKMMGQYAVHPRFRTHARDQFASAKLVNPSK